jgi:hypothetical protein
VIDFDILLDISKRIHNLLGTDSAFEKKSGGLDLVEIIKQSDLKLKNTESFFNFLDQNRQSNLKFASFDKDPVRKKSFLVKAISITEEEIKLSKFDNSFNKNKKIITYLNYIEEVRIITMYFSKDSRKDILIHLTYLIDSLETEITFLKSWFLIVKSKIMRDLEFFDDAKAILEDAKKKYFENYSDFYFGLQNDYGKNYWSEEIIKLENELSRQQ